MIITRFTCPSCLVELDFEIEFDFHKLIEERDLTECRNYIQCNHCGARCELDITRMVIL